MLGLINFWAMPEWIYVRLFVRIWGYQPGCDNWWFCNRCNRVEEISLISAIQGCFIKLHRFFQWTTGGHGRKFKKRHRSLQPSPLVPPWLAPLFQPFQVPAKLDKVSKRCVNWHKERQRTVQRRRQQHPQNDTEGLNAIYDGSTLNMITPCNYAWKYLNMAP